MKGSQTSDATIAVYTGRGTVVYVRVLALESIVKNYEPSLVFEDLAKIEELLVSRIRGHGALVDGRLASGLSCFFGWQSSTGKEPLAHIAEAFACAEDLQSEISKDIHRDTSIRHPMFLLQIAIATDIYHVCRSKSSPSSHLGVVGSGFQAAMKIIDYCGIKSVIMTSDTEQLLESTSERKRKKHEVRIKLPNSNKVLLCYEYDLFGSDSESYRIVTNRIKESISRRVNERWDCSESDILVKINGENFQLVNISKGGLEIRGKTALFNGQAVTIDFENASGSLGTCTEKLGFAAIDCEVRWSRTSEDLHRFGLMILGLETKQRDELVSLIISNGKKRLAI